MYTLKAPIHTHTHTYTKYISTFILRVFSRRYSKAFRNTCTLLASTHPPCLRNTRFCRGRAYTLAGDGMVLFLYIFYAHILIMCIYIQTHTFVACGENYKITLPPRTTLLRHHIQIHDGMASCCGYPWYVHPLREPLRI